MAQPLPDDFHLEIEARSPLKAMTLSAILPGLGQLYNRETIRGAIFITLSAILIGLIVYTQWKYNWEFEKFYLVEQNRAEAISWANAQVPFKFLPILIFFFLDIYSLVDAYSFATHTKHIGIYRQSSLEKLADKYTENQKSK